MAAPGLRRRRVDARILAVLVGAALAGAWWLAHDPPLHHAGSDLYGHLGVARHLVRGDGFVNDAVYPLSLAFPFAARVPQPLVHRPPGYPLLLTAPVALSGGDPARAERLVAALTVLLLAGIAGFGARGALAAGREDVILPWLLLLLVNPLLHMTVGWSQVEIPTALLLIWLWTRLRARDDRDAVGAGPALLDGTLAAGVALLRPELAWLPWLWLLWLGRRRGRALAASAGAWAALLAPWWIRNLLVTGNPVFTLQAYAEHLKQTPDWPGYAIYGSLQPETIWQTLARTPATMLDKTLAGLRYYLARLDDWLPTTLWLLGGLGGVSRLVAKRDRRDPLLVLGASLALMTLLYAPLSHTLRYMAVILPVLSLELWRAFAEGLAARGGGRPATALALALATAAVLWLTPAGMPGWLRARDAAADSAARLPAALTRLAETPAGPVFTDSAALLWHGDRAGVWIPEGVDMEAEIRRRVPDMERAPTVSQGPNAGGSGDD